jgi:hypothetical protein
MAMSKICVAMDDEDAKRSAFTTAWRYFCSKEMEGATGAAFPVTDGRPRVWRLGKTDYSTWSDGGG